MARPDVFTSSSCLVRVDAEQRAGRSSQRLLPAMRLSQDGGREAQGTSDEASPLPALALPRPPGCHAAARSA
eukprot:765020-Hanusia_phi.AAC.1